MVRIPRLNVVGRVDFLVDTGATATSLSPNDTRNLRIPTLELTDPARHRGIAGTRTYYREPALVMFPDGAEWRQFDIDLYVATPDEGTDYLPSLLGRDILNTVQMDYYFPRGRLEFTVGI